MRIIKVRLDGIDCSSCSKLVRLEIVWLFIFKMMLFMCMLVLVVGLFG